ncbi:hypothetical protein [Streptomyces sp.]|uniref:hypothetical protein n=1 Tax=Streptomyces sp. TaxID=1931 RepID=UPI002812498B|nr:hypothetical protein [Streptomyces sp.]
MDVEDLPQVAAPETPLDFELWGLLERGGGERVAVLNVDELRAATLLLRVLAAGDGVGHEQALALAGRIDRRLPDAR